MTRFCRCLFAASRQFALRRTPNSPMFLLVGAREGLPFTCIFNGFNSRNAHRQRKKLDETQMHEDSLLEKIIQVRAHT